MVFGGVSVETFNLDNGIKVIYKHTNTAEIASLKFCSPVSVLHENTAKSGETTLLYSVMSKSTKSTLWKSLPLFCTDGEIAVFMVSSSKKVYFCTQFLRQKAIGKRQQAKSKSKSKL